MDIVFPKDNEAQFLKQKENIRFIYPFKKHLRSEHEFGVLTDKKFDGFTVWRSTGNDRPVFERGVSLIYDLEQSDRHDFIYQRNSGMNHVLAALAKRKHMSIGFNMNTFLKSHKKATLFGRMQQNMRLCEKYGVTPVVASFAQSPGEVVDDIYLDAFERLLKKKKLF